MNANEDPVQRALNLKGAYDAGVLDARGREELAHLLRTNPACRNTLGADQCLHRLLQVYVRPADPEIVIAGLHRRRAAEASASSFLRRVHTRRKRRGRLSRSWRPTAWLGVAIAASVVAAVMVLLRGPQDVAPLSVVTATHTSVDGLVVAPDANVELAVGQQVSTAAAGAATIHYADDSVITLSEHSRLEVVAVQPNKRLALHQGQVTVDVQPQAVDHPFTIVTPHGEARVVGTRFTLTVDRSTVLAVATGLVRLTDASGVVKEVRAGERAEIGPPAAVSAMAPADAIAAYDFTEAAGDLVRERGGSGLDLRIEDPEAVTWVPGGGLRLHGSTRLRSIIPAAALVQACRASGAFSVVVDIEPDVLDPVSTNPLDLPKRIICLPNDVDARNFSLGQGLYEGPLDVFDMRLFTSRGSARGRPSVVTSTSQVQARRMSVAFTRAASGECTFAIDGRQVAVELVDADDQRSRPVMTAQVPGTLAVWDDGLHLTLGAEAFVDANGRRAWSGTFHRVAIFARALSADEMVTLHAAWRSDR